MQQNLATTTMGTVIMVDVSGIIGVAAMGATFEAADPLGWTPVVGDAVLLDYIEASRQWIIAAVF